MTTVSTFLKKCETLCVLGSSQRVHQHKNVKMCVPYIDI